MNYRTPREFDYRAIYKENGLTEIRVIRPFYRGTILDSGTIDNAPRSNDTT